MAVLDSFNAILSKDSIEELKKLHETHLEEGKLLLKIEEKYIHTLDQMVDLVSEDKD